MNAQGEAILGLAHRRGLLDESIMRRAQALDGDAARVARGLQQLGVETGSLRMLMKDLARMRFVCARCRVEATFEALAVLEHLACSRCSSPLQAKDSTLAPSSLRFVDESTAPPARSANTKRSGTAARISTSRGRIEGAKEIGPFETIKVLGKGANGTVWLARKPGLDRLFALKVLAGNALADDLAVERFRREAQVASRLEQHPGIVSVVDVGEASGCHYYAMDYCPGPTLQSVFADNAPLEPLAAAEIVADLARAIGFAHSHDVVHRDLKPANVIVDERTSKPRITDFGLAHDRRDQRVTRTGDVLGTPYYMAPEQFRGEKDVDARADIYALGGILYEALTGRRPFEAETVALLASVVLTEELRPPSEVNKAVPRELDAIVNKAMAKAREKRYERAELLADDLDRFRAGIAPRDAPEETTVQRTLRRTRRHVGWRTVVALALVLALLGGAAAVVGITMLSGVKRERGRELLEDATRRTRRGAGIGEIEQLLTQARSSLGSTPEIELAWAGALAKRGRGADACAVASAVVASSPAFVASATLIQAEVCARGDLAAAARLLEPIAAAVPVARARQLLFLANNAEAEKKARAALAANPDDLLALGTLALALARQGEIDAGREIAIRALELAPGDPDVIVARAFVELRAPGAFPPAREKEVEEWLAHALELEKGEPDALIFLERAWIRLARADLEGARDALRTAEGRRHDAEAAGLLPSIEAVLGVNPRRLIRLSPTACARFVTLSASASGPARGHLLVALLAAGEGLPADAAFTAAVAAGPRDPVVALARFRWLVGRDRSEEAAVARDAAREVGCDRMEIDRLEADRLWRKGSVAEAAAIFRQLAHDDPNGFVGQYARSAFWLLREDGVTSTRNRIQTIVANANDSPELHRLYAYSLVIPEIAMCDPATLAKGSGEAAKAIELAGVLDLESFFLQDFGGLVHWTNTASNRSPAGFDDLAQKFLPLVPGSGRYRYFLGRAALKWSEKGFEARARQAFEDAGKVEPGRALRDLGLALLEMRKGFYPVPEGYRVNKEAMAIAKGHLTRARQLEPDCWIPREWMAHVKQEDREFAATLTLPPLPDLDY